MRILFVHNALQSFVRIDRDILAERHDVKLIYFRWRACALAQVFEAVRSCDCVYGWFASHHTLLPVLLANMLGKKSVICVADYDIANEPEYDYGSMRGGVRKRVNNLIFTLADVVLATSDFSRRLALQNTVLSQFPDKLRTVYLGLEPRPISRTSKTNRVVTIGNIGQPLAVWRKGLITFVESAKFTPEMIFEVIGHDVGQSADMIKRNAGRNVVFSGPLSDGERDKHLDQAAVYAQLSYMEGFGMAVAEAMLAECVPVVTARGSLPEVVGDCGIYVPFDDAESSAEGIITARTSPNLGKMARARITELFPLSKRRDLLLDLMVSL